MKTIFDRQTRDALLKRTALLTTAMQPQWGKMSPFQMVKHCNLSEEMFQAKTSYRRLFIGRLFGGMALKGLLKNEEPIHRNQPTHPLFKISGTGDFDAERNKWTALIAAYEDYRSDGFVHPFFGAMNREQIGAYVYKHTDHHLRQFGV